MVPLWHHWVGVRHRCSQCVGGRSLSQPLFGWVRRSGFRGGGRPRSTWLASSRGDRCWSDQDASSVTVLVQRLLPEAVRQMSAPAIEAADPRATAFSGAPLYLHHLPAIEALALRARQGVLTGNDECSAPQTALRRSVCHKLIGTSKLRSYERSCAGGSCCNSLRGPPANGTQPDRNGLQ